MAAPAARAALITNGLTVAAPFGGGGVSDVTYDTANAEEMQVLISGGLGEAETGGPSINIVPKSGGNQFRGSAFYSMSGDWATSNNLNDQMRGFGITQPPALRTNWDASGSIGGPVKQDRLWFFANVRSWANASVVDGIFANRFAGDASHWDYAANPAIEARVAESRKIYAGRLTAQLTPRNRITFSHDYQRRCGGSSSERRRRWLPSGRQRLGRVGPHVRRRHRVAGIVSRLPRLPLQHHAGHLFGSDQQPPAARSGLLAIHSTATRDSAWRAPDGLMDLIPVTEQSASTAVRNFIYRGVFDPLDFGFNDNKALQSAWRASAVLCHRRAQLQGRLPGLLLSRAQRTRRQQHAAALHVQQPGARSPCRLLPGAALGPARSHGDGGAVRAGSVDAGPADAARRACATTARGAGRRPRATARPATSRFNPQPITFERTVSVTRLQRHHAAHGRRLRRVRQRQDGAQGQRRQVPRRRPPPTSSTAPTTRPRASSRASARPAAARGWTDGNGNSSSTATC